MTVEREVDEGRDWPERKARIQQGKCQRCSNRLRPGNAYNCDECVQEMTPWHPPQKWTLLRGGRAR